MTRRRRGGNQLVVIYWRDIPAQVNGVAGADKTQHVLKRRFQRSIDAAAMAAGITTATEYVKQWRRVTEPVPAGVDVAASAQQRAEELDFDFPAERLRAIADNGGWDVDSAHDQKGHL